MEQEQKLNPIMIKSYTDLEQSKKLAKILPLESADMVYIKHSSSYNPTWEFNEDFPPMILGNVPINKMTVEVLPCWSLAALLSILPKSVRLVGTPKDSYWYCECVNGNNQWYAGFGSAENPVDACYEMLLKLNELKRL